LQFDIDQLTPTLRHFEIDAMNAMREYLLSDALPRL